MKQKVFNLFVYAVSILALLLTPLSALAEGLTEEAPVANPVIITEVQTGGASAGDEFVELFNTSDNSVDMTGWQVRFNAAGAANDTTTLLATIGSKEAPAVLPGMSYFLLHTANIALPSGVSGQEYAPVLSKGDKTVALFARDETVCKMIIQDAAAWEANEGTTWGEGRAVKVTDTSVNAEKLLQRFVDTTGGYIDTNDNAHDFYLAQGSPGENNTLIPSGAPQGSASALQPLPAADCTPPPDEEPPTPDPDEDLEFPILTELLPNPVGTDPGNEYVEIYNPNDTPTNLKGYALTSGTRTYTFTDDTMLGAGEYRAFLLTITLVNTNNDSVRLINPDSEIVSESDPYGSAGQEGRAWALIDDVWQWSDEPTPNMPNGGIEEPPGEDPLPNEGLLSPQLTELLPDPGSGLSDSKDEFIELYNPNDKPFDLSGYIIEVGLTNKVRHIIPEGIIMQPHAYLALFSADTDNGPLLVNSGGQVSLLAPQGGLLSQTTEYPKAKPDQAWALIDGVWQWTLKPTPNAANIAEAPLAASAASAKTKSAAKTKKSTSKKSTAKTKKAAKDDDKDQGIAAAITKPNDPLHPGVLAAVGVFAVLYGAYEYRHDLANRVRIFRANREARSALGQGAKGR